MPFPIGHLRRHLWLVALLAALALVLADARAGPVARAEQPDHQDAIEPFARDVFVIVGSTLRNPDPATTADSASLFNAAGVNLGITWGKWKRASAQSTVHVVGGPNKPVTAVRIQLTGLIPGGVYSLFYGTIGPDSENPLCPGVERTLPLISTDKYKGPDASSFVADALGQADFSAEVPGRLLDALQVFFSVVYHSDGHTYGSLPNAGEFQTQGATCRRSFGEDAMRQMLILQKW